MSDINCLYTRQKYRIAPPAAGRHDEVKSRPLPTSEEEEEKGEAAAGVGVVGGGAGIRGPPSQVCFGSPGGDGDGGGDGGERLRRRRWSRIPSREPRRGRGRAGHRRSAGWVRL